MSDAAPAPVSPKKTGVKTKKASTKQKKPAEHPVYQKMIEAAIIAGKERKGSSRQAILKYIKENYKVGDGVDFHVKVALKRGVVSGSLKQMKGIGASGSFKVSKDAPKTAKPAKKLTKPKPATKKAKVVKKKSPKKEKVTKTKAKSPKKAKSAAKKPAAKKAVKKTGGKKVAKPAAKKVAAKKPKATKPKGKKAAPKAKA